MTNTFHCSCPLRAPFCPAINLSQYYYSSPMPKQLHQTQSIETEFLTNLDSVMSKLFRSFFRRFRSKQPDLDVASRICHECHAVFLDQCSCYLVSHLSSADVLFVLPAGKCQCLVWKLFSATAFLWATCGAPNLDLPLTRPLAMVIFATQTVEW